MFGNLSVELQEQIPIGIVDLGKAECGHAADAGVGCGEPAVVVQPQA